MKVFWQACSRARLSVVLAAALAVGLLHGPSMMLARTAPTIADCHTAIAKHSTGHAHASSGDHAGAAANSGEPAADDTTTVALASACPHANIAAISPPAVAATPLGRPMPLVAAEPAALTSAILDRPDPPPRVAA